MNVLEKFKLNNMVAVITGAGKGIGRGIAISLAEAGADIVVASRNRKDLQRTSDAIISVGKRCLIVPTDVTNKDQLEDLALKTKNEFGKIDIWVNNAGGLPDATPRYMSKTSEDEFDAQINLNLKAVWSACVIASNYMQGTGGSIINISSATSKNMKPNIKNGPYGAAKSAVNSLTATFSLELAPNIRVNAIAPGPIPTDNFKDSLNLSNQQEVDSLTKALNLPLQRLGEVEDIGSAVVFMASPASSWITGQCLFVDGGS